MATAEKTTSRSEGQQAPAAPSISPPKGGGAVHGIGEKFAANPVTVPAPSPSRWATSGVTTEYLYDLLTLRLTSQKTTRASDRGRLQDLSYTYGPVGTSSGSRTVHTDPIGAPEER